jgi:cathepsin F
MNLTTKVIIFSLIICFVISDNTEVPDELKDKVIFNHFQNFLKAYNISYTTNEELQARLDVFKDNYIRLDERLKKKKQYHLSGITRFFDLTTQEFSKKYLSLDLPLSDVIKAQKVKGSWMEKQNADPDVKFRNLNKTSNDSASDDSTHNRMLQTTSLPLNFDWRAYGIVGTVRNQGSCGSCWSFSSVCVLEGRYAMKYGVLENFSEQQLINCDTYDNGCNGGNAGSAFYYLQYFSAGLIRETDMPYAGYQYTCNTSNKTPIAKVSSYLNAGTTDENYIQSMLYAYGPLSASMNANYLQYYRSGIIDMSASTCNPLTLNHAVNIVGWGVENGVNFWIVRNSWGSSWGESGYFRIARGKGTCGINKYIVTAFVK